MLNSKAAMLPVPTKHFFAGEKLSYAKWSTTAPTLNNFGGTPLVVMLA